MIPEAVRSTDSVSAFFAPARRILRFVASNEGLESNGNMVLLFNLQIGKIIERCVEGPSISTQPFLGIPRHLTANGGCVDAEKLGQ